MAENEATKIDVCIHIHQRKNLTKYFFVSMCRERKINRNRARERGKMFVASCITNDTIDGAEEINTYS